jgi:predicted phage terminase large subunit-like protein
MGTATATPSRFKKEFAFDEYEVLASICEDSYFKFFKYFASIFIDEEIVYNWHVKYLCNELQLMAERLIAGQHKLYDLVVNLPPGMTKSSIFSIGFTPWLWTRMPRARVMVATHTADLGQELSMSSRNIVRSELYHKCWPHLTLREDLDTKDRWGNNFGGWRMTCTVGGRTPTGFHAHALFVDDAIDPKKSVSAAEIKGASDFCRVVLPTRKVNKRTAFLAMVSQRLDLDDPPGDRLRNEKAGPVKHICLPCDITWEIKPPELKRRYKKQGGLLDPQRLPKHILKQEHGTLGNFGYAGQYGQSPLPKGGIIFDVTQFEHHITTPPKDIEFRRIVRYWDKAYSQNSGAYTAGVKLGVTKEGIYWILDVVRVQEESYRREKLIRLTAGLDGKHVRIYVEQEPAAGKESVQNTIRNLAGFIVRADRRGGVNDANKVMRADPFATQVNAGNVWLAKGAWNADYIQELQYFSDKAKYKDQTDASSGAFNVVTRIRTVGAI